MSSRSRAHLEYRPELDGLRALAVLVVLVNHLNHDWLPSGFLGVDLFFVISGYVVTGSLASRDWPGAWPLLLEFYQRRCRRLLPALIACVALVSLVFVAVVHPADDALDSCLRTGLAALFGLANLYLLRQGNDYFGMDSSFQPFLHTWSLGVEEQFYLVWPLLLIGCGLGAGATPAFRRRLAWLCLLLSAASLAFLVALLARGAEAAGFYLMPARFWELAAGALAWLRWRPRRHPAEPRRQGRWAPLTAALCLIAFAGLMLVPERWRLASTLIAVPVSAALMLQLEGSRGVGRWLAQPLPLAIGLASYSLYLWHWPVIVLARWTVGITAATLPAILALIAVLTALSHRLEVRFRRPAPGASRSPRRALVLYPALSLLVAMVLQALMGPARAALFLGDRQRLALDLSTSRKIPGTSVDTPHCFREPTAALQADAEDLPCVVNRHPGRPTLYFEGDSHTEMLMPIGAPILQRTSFNVAFFARGGCPWPWFPGWPQFDQPRYERCRSHVEQRLRRLSGRLRPGDQLVLVSNWPNYLLDPDPALQRRRLEAYRLALEDLSRQVGERGAGLVVFAPLPSFPSRGGLAVPASLCLREWFRPASRLDRLCQPMRQSREAELNRLAPVRELLLGLGARLSNLRAFDPFPAICPSGAPCSTHRGDLMLYTDATHLTRAGAGLVADRLLPVLAPPPVGSPDRQGSEGSTRGAAAAKP